MPLHRANVERVRPGRALQNSARLTGITAALHFFPQRMTSHRPHPDTTTTTPGGALRSDREPSRLAARTAAHALWNKLERSLPIVAAASRGRLAVRGQCQNA